MKERWSDEAEFVVQMRSFEKELDISPAFDWLLVEAGPAAVLDRERRRLGADPICIGAPAGSWLSGSLLGQHGREASR